MKDIITLEYFKEWLPEWSESVVSDAAIERFILAASYIVGSEGSWQNKFTYDQATLYVAAHNLQRWQNVQESALKGNINPKIITSETYGDTSITRGGVNVFPTSFIQDEFNTTHYGLQYLKLLESKPRYGYIR